MVLGLSMDWKELSNTMDIPKNRHGKNILMKRDDALRAVIRELNDKWNAIAGLFEKKQGASPIRRNAFWDEWVKQIPELDPNYNSNRVTFDYSNPNVLPTLAMLGAMALGEI